jgi:hypothetical protein
MADNQRRRTAVERLPRAAVLPSLPVSARLIAPSGALDPNEPADHDSDQ